ncbi:MAG: hypothetical protein DHS20C12_15960 [Pseudohongiella sp.]|nr:MAG: hypothetical protein DHS20C12_15960 [Pseudohongiella sp.]
MNRINPAKLHNSKWTALAPQRREKHFIVTELKTDAEGVVVSCAIEAVLSRRVTLIDWQELKDASRWAHGWQ